MLELKNIYKTFNPGTVNEKKAITDLSLELKKGDFATIIGSNGAGKSTLFNAICGDFLTDAGSIELDGRDITFMPQHARAKEIGRLYQDPMRGTAPGMTIEENLRLAFFPQAVNLIGQIGVVVFTIRQSQKFLLESLQVYLRKKTYRLKVPSWSIPSLEPIFQVLRIRLEFGFADVLQ